jgi:hypothetical protein
MRSDGGNTVSDRSASEIASSSGQGNARQIPPRQLAAGIEAVQPPAQDVPGWAQAEPDGIIDLQPAL